LKSEILGLEDKLVSAPPITCEGMTFEMSPAPGQDYPEDLLFTPQQLVGRYFLNSHGSRLLCAYVEHQPDRDPTVCFIPDFSTDLSKHKGLVATQWDVNSIQWRNAEKNLPDMQLTLDRLPQVDTVFLVGSGPALMKNWRELERVKGKPGVAIVGCNELLQYLSPGLLDYFLCLDACSPDKWWEGWDCSQTTAVFAPITPPSFKRADWKRMLWYKIGLQSDFNSFINNRKGHLTTLIPVFGVGPLELQFAWLLRPKRVVLVGHSYAYDRIDGVIYEHINEPLLEDRWEGVLSTIGECATVDIDGNPVVTDFHILMCGSATLAHCQVLLDNGIEVLNCTEGGVLRSSLEIPAFRDRPLFPQKARLRDVVETML